MIEKEIAIHQPLIIDQEKLQREIMFLLGIFVGAISIVIITVLLMYNQQQRYGSKISALNQEITEINDAHEQALLEFQASLAAAKEETANVQAQYDTYVTDMETKNDATFAVLQKYWYVFKEANAAGGLSIEMIQYADRLCKEKDVNPHMVWAIIDVESDYNTQAKSSKSSATGLGQLLASTAKSIYENYMGNGSGSYDRSMARNGYTNLNIMINYLAYLKANYNDASRMIAGYSGDISGTYYGWYAKEMNQYGHSPTTISYK